MTLVAYLFAVGSQFQAVLSMAAIALLLAAVLLGGPIATDADHSRKRRFYRLAAAAAVAGALCALLAAAIPGREDIKKSVDLARVLMCQPGGCK